MQRHPPWCLPKGKEPFRHTTKGIFRLGDKIDTLKEIDAYGGVVFDSGTKLSSSIVFLSSSLPHPLTPDRCSMFYWSVFQIKLLYSIHLYLSSCTYQVLIVFTGFKEGVVLPSISWGLSAPSGVRLHCSDVALPFDFHHDVHRTPQVRVSRHQIP